MEATRITDDDTYNKVDLLVENATGELIIIKGNQFDEAAKTPLDDWARFLKTETIPENTQAKGLKEAKDTLNVMQLPPDAILRIYAMKPTPLALNVNSVKSKAMKKKKSKTSDAFPSSPPPVR